MEVLRKAPDPIFDLNLIPEFLEKNDDEDNKNRRRRQKMAKMGLGRKVGGVGGGWVG